MLLSREAPCFDRLGLLSAQRNLEKISQFYETYSDSKIVSALLTQLSWTHHALLQRIPA
jgi:DUF1016 N-terminal domain